jgi:predicted phage terminase large subunit-like protein
VVEQAGCEPQDVKTYTFIRSSIYDNQIGLSRDPGYLANLKALPRVDREQLLYGNWKIRPSAGNYFRREWFGVVEDVPHKDIVNRVRFWDRAATEKREGTDPDATVGVLLAESKDGVYYVEHVVKMFATAHAVEQAIINTAASDPEGTSVCFNQDPGSAGKGEAEQMARKLAGFDVHFWPTGRNDKETRAKPVSSQAEARNIFLVRSEWNRDFLVELENFPDGAHDDCVDALAGAFTFLIDSPRPWGKPVVFEDSKVAQSIANRRDRRL